MRRRLKNDNTVRMRIQKIKEKRAAEDFSIIGLLCPENKHSLGSLGY